MDDDLDYMDGYFDAQFGYIPRSMSGDYYMGFLAYQDELSERKDEIQDELDSIGDEVSDDIDMGDFDSARDAIDRAEDLQDELDDVDSLMY